VFLVLAVAGCAQQADVDQMRNDQSQIRGMIATQNQSIQALQQQIRRQRDEIEEFQHGGSGGTGLTDQIASLQDRLNKLEATVNALQASAAVPPPGAAPTPAPGGATGVTPGGPSTPPAPETPGWQADLDKELATNASGAGARPYREGLQAMKDGKYSLAVAKFAQVQKRYPKSPLTEPADYFSANALFESGKYDQSILQFNDLAMRFPKGRFASAALLREAQAFLKLNDKIDARLTLQKLIADHSDSTEASAANAMMKDLQN